MNGLLQNKPLLGAILLVAAVVVAGLLFRQGSSKVKSSNVRVYEGEAVVEMTEDGFVPEHITVKKGTKVRFVNKDKYAHWPASDLHPSHTIYPEFDPKKPIKAEDQWSFTFERVGDWAMHDHIAPYMTGIITVVE